MDDQTDVEEVVEVEVARLPTSRVTIANVHINNECAK